MTAWIVAGIVALGVAAHAEPLTLSDAIVLARRNHPEARAARAAEHEARANVGVALSGYLPGVGLSLLARGDAANFPPVVVGTATNANSTSTTTGVPFAGSFLYSASLALTQVLVDGGHTLGQLAAARAQLAAANADVSSEGLVIESSVTAAYFAALEAEAQLGVARDQEALLRAQLESVRKLVGAGIRPELDAISAETRVDRAVLDRIRAEGLVPQRRASLLAAIGLASDPGYSLVDAFVGELPEQTRAVDQLISQAEGQRPELLSLDAATRAAEQRVRSTRSDYFPSLFLTLDATATGDNGAPKPLFDFFAALSVQQSIFSGLSTYRATQAARAALDRLRARADAERVQIRASVATALAALTTAQSADQQTSLLVEQAEKLVHSAQKRYEAGLLSLLELADAHNQRFFARGERVTTHYAVALARADLKRAIGGTIVPAEASR